MDLSTYVVYDWASMYVNPEQAMQKFSKYVISSYGHVVRDFESEAKTR